eukprot:gene4012-7991_t
MSSVLTSANMSVNRSSTRRHAPPGGNSSISFGSYESDKQLPPPVAIFPAAAGVHVEMPTIVEETVAPVEFQLDTSSKVGVVLVLGEGSDMVLASMKSALKLVGFASVVITTVEDPIMMPYTVQVLLRSCDIVIGLGLIIEDVAGSLTNIIISALLQVGTLAGIPVIPGIFHATSVTEAEAVLPALATKWSIAAAGLMATKTAITTSLELLSAPEPVPTPEVAVESPVEVRPVTAPAPSTRTAAVTTNPGRAVGGKSTFTFG